MKPGFRFPNEAGHVDRRRRLPEFRFQLGLPGTGRGQALLELRKGAHVGDRVGHVPDLAVDLRHASSELVFDVGGRTLVSEQLDKGLLVLGDQLGDSSRSRRAATTAWSSSFRAVEDDRRA